MLRLGFGLVSFADTFKESSWLLIFLVLIPFFFSFSLFIFSRALYMFKGRKSPWFEMFRFCQGMFLREGVLVIWEILCFYSIVVFIYKNWASRKVAGVGWNQVKLRICGNKLLKRYNHTMYLYNFILFFFNSVTYCACDFGI